MNEITMEIIERLGTLNETSEDNTITKQVNIIRWNGGNPKIDIRAWSATGKAYKGISLTEEEASNLYTILHNHFKGADSIEQ